MFSEQDLKQLEKKGISLEKAQKQIANFEAGFQYLNIDRPATVEDGVLRFTEEEVKQHEEEYGQRKQSLKVLKFVPASGAATRMFKDLYAYYHHPRSNHFKELEDLKEQGFGPIYTFMSQIRDFPFWPQLKQVLEKDGHNADELVSKHEIKTLLRYLLEDDGLGYGNLPKGLLAFHRYPHGTRTPIEEHMVEAANYGESRGKAAIHFTISPEHKEGFQALVNKVRSGYEDAFNLNYTISYSEQKPSTDTLAVDMDNAPFRQDDSSILFRPGGHGALIENLNDLDADIIFIKNIDNVVPDRLKPTTYKYKRVIANVLLSFQERIFAYLGQLRNPSVASDDLLNEVEQFLAHELYVKFPDNQRGRTASERTKMYIEKLNRPIRVAGMVKNEGEPGGGPFWVRDTSGGMSVQIVESSQIDPEDPEKQTMVQSATHFNPVDLVCGVRDSDGNKFDLKDYVDPETGFISEKTKDGRKLKAQELPGLWNGAMADWNTIFVEVPIETFNPVKTVNDLLRPQHLHV